MIVNTQARRHEKIGASILIGLALCLLVAGGTVFAEVPAHDSGDREMIERIRAMDSDTETRVFGLLRAQATWPLGIAGGVGAILVRQPRHYDCRTWCDFSGLTAQLQPGTAGMQIGVGYGTLIGETRSSHRFVSHVFSGYSVKGVVLRLWDDDTADFSHPTLWGAEASVTITKFNFSLGVLRPFQRETGDNHWLITGGIGWGF
jgi:hypothetical protein